MVVVDYEDYRIDIQVFEDNAWLFLAFIFTNWFHSVSILKIKAYHDASRNAIEKMAS